MAVRIESGIEVMNDDHAAWRAEEQQHHDRDQAAAVAASCTTSRSAARTNCDWSNVSITFNPLGAVGGCRAVFLDRIDDRQGRSIGVLHHEQVGGIHSVEAHHVGFGLMRVGNRANVGEEHRRTVEVT